ncbi:MAG: cation:proton antiporter [Synechococcales cyanobacterium]
MLESILWIVLTGFFGGQLARRLGIPSLVGMILAGIVLGPQVSDMIRPEVLASAPAWRTLAVMVILMKAGLGLDRAKLAQQGSVALRLGFLPAACEAVVVAVVSMVVFHFDFPTGLLLGCILGAESPAVIVPGMLRLKSLGWGVEKGIPDAILTGSALSDVLLLLVFNLLLVVLTQGGDGGVILPGGFTLSRLQVVPIQLVVQICGGLGVGWVTARILVSVLVKQNWIDHAIHDTLLAASAALLLVVLADHVPVFSGYLAVMATGFCLIEMDAPLARRLRQGFDSLWVIAEVILFVLLGASIPLAVLGQTLGWGVLVLVVGTLVGRGLGWFLATWGSDWTGRERLFLLPGNSAKATVQAAIGAIPLSQGIAGGEIILALAVLSILITAPLGAWGIPTFAPKLLSKDEVDPTKVTISGRVLLLAAVDTSPLSAQVLTQTAALARRSEAEVIVLHVIRQADAAGVAQVQALTRQLLADIRYRWLETTGAVAETIVRVAQEEGVNEIIMGKRGHRTLGKVWLGSVSQTVIESSPIPVLVIEAVPAPHLKSGP